MTGEELFLNELNFHIRQGVSKKDLTDLINERLKQLTIPVVVDSFFCEGQYDNGGDGCDVECESCKRL